MEAGLYTLVEAAGLTGLSIEALRKRVTRRKVEAVKGNDGRVRVRLDNRTIADLKRESLPGRPSGRLGRQPDGQSLDFTAIKEVLAAMGEHLASVRTDLDRERAEVVRLREQNTSIRAGHERERADWTKQIATAWTDLDGERSRANRAEGIIEGMKAAQAKAEAEAAQLRQTADQARADAIQHRQARMEAEQSTQAAEVEAAQLRQAVEQARAETIQHRQARAEAEQAIQAADAEAVRLRQEAEALRQAEVARVTAQAAEAADRPAMVASRIDEVQFRRLQEAELARKSLGLLARLRAAWRGE